MVNVRPIADPLGFRPVDSGAGQAADRLGLLLDQRFFPIFSLLFGIGCALLVDAAAARTTRPRVVPLRRLLALLVLGLLHLLLLWRGDILTTYAVVGLLVLLPSTRPPRAAVAGLAGVLLAAALLLAHGGNVLVPGLFLLGSALVRHGVVDRLDGPGPATGPALIGLGFAAAAVPALWLQTSSDPAGGGHARAMAVAGLLLAGCTSAA